MKRPTFGRAAIIGVATAAVAAGAAVVARSRSGPDLSTETIARRFPWWGRSELRPPPERRREGPFVGSGPTQ